MNVIYFDLDGPLLDVAEKYYRTYYDIVKINGFEAVDKFLYWELKRNKTPEKEILGLTGANSIINSYKIRRKSIIESEQYMNFDTLQPMAIDVLEELKKKKVQMFLVTLRTSANQLHKQLRKLGILDYFNDIMSSGEEINPRWKIKFDLISQRGNGHPFKEAFFVGDTETDILAANQLGLYSVAVLNGIRNLQRIKEAKSQYVLTGIHDLLKLI